MYHNDQYCIDQWSFVQIYNTRTVGYEISKRKIVRNTFSSLPWITESLHISAQKIPWKTSVTRALSLLSEPPKKLLGVFLSKQVLTNDLSDVTERYHFSTFSSPTSFSTSLIFISKFFPSCFLSTDTYIGRLILM